MQKKLMGVHKVSAFHPVFFQQSGKSTIIRYVAVPHHFVSYLVFFFPGIHVDPGPYIVTSPENTYPRGKHGEIKVHRSNACDMSWVRARLCKLQKGCTRLAAASDKVYSLFGDSENRENNYLKIRDLLSIALFNILGTHYVIHI